MRSLGLGGNSAMRFAIPVLLAAATCTATAIEAGKVGFGRKQGVPVPLHDGRLLAFRQSLASVPSAPRCS